MCARKKIKTKINYKTHVCQQGNILNDPVNKLKLFFLQEIYVDHLL